MRDEGGSKRKGEREEGTVSPGGVSSFYDDKFKRVLLTFNIISIIIIL